MNDSSTSQDTGSTVADAADRIASLLGPADSETDETQEAAEASDADEDEPEQSDDTPEGEVSDEQDKPEEADEQPTTYTVKVAGEDVEVTLDEALKGYSREADYTRKTQAHAEQVKADNAVLAAARDEYLTGLETVQKIIEANQPRVDQSLRDTNPAEWSAQMLQHRLWGEQRQAVAAETERLNSEKAREQAAEQKAQADAEWEKLVGAIPEMADPQKAAAETGKFVSAGAAYGYTADEINGVIDHRALLVLRDAARYRELVSKSTGVRAKVEAVKTAKPGSTSAPPSKVQDLQRAKTRLRQSGRVDDAAAAIERLLAQ